NLYQDTKTQDILMPGAKPNTPDTYLCTTYPVLEEELYIYKFEALANAATAHHMLLYGCDGEPFSTDSIWCRSQDFEDSEPADHSGLKLYTTHQKPQYVAGIFLLDSGDFTIPLHTNLYPVDISCTFMMDKSIFPFAFRTHAHGLDTVITDYQYNGTYHKIGKGNPQWPQAGDTGPSYHTLLKRLNPPDTIHSVADPSGECAFNELTQLTGKNFPIDVSVPLPPSPALEEAAIGSHNHAGMNHPGEANVDFEDTQILKILMLGASPRKPVWNCPAMCKNSHPVILFARAKNAPPTILPKDVGLRFGNRTFIKNITKH
ncbi:alpha-amidating enzyme precursor 2, partial [Biomphalaria glabrata]